MVETEQLIGQWEVYGAERNGKETSLLNKAVFAFDTNDSLTTNFTGQEETGMFSVEDNTIVFHNDPEMQFRITRIQGDTLSLSTELHQMRFNLNLHKTGTGAH